jgi:hypothetical protein
MNTFARAQILAALNWTLGRRPFRALLKLAAVAIAADLGYRAGWAGFGTGHLGVHAHATVALWHSVMAPLTAWLFAAVVYAHGPVNRIFARQNVNPAVVAIVSLPVYLFVYAIVVVCWASWTLPFWAAWQAVVLILGLARPLTRRAILVLTPPPAADVTPPASAVVGAAEAIANAARARA